MKLESLKSEKFRKLENNELNKINGGNDNLSQEIGTGVTVTWTKLEHRTDEICSDC
ncbi:bacteriocin [Flavobacterium sp. HNIBRBA15423]|uniref:bacteriocin n=1 Tax=Flavobacterium sp. HNIBRBA15423 TaxID=3458683 RepID=UPI004044DA8E